MVFTIQKFPQEMTNENIELPIKYLFTYIKIIKDINGNDVSINDEGKTIVQTENEIILNRTIFQTKVDECNSKLAEIAKLA